MLAMGLEVDILVTCGLSFLRSSWINVFLTLIEIILFVVSNPVIGFALSDSVGV